MSMSDRMDQAAESSVAKLLFRVGSPIVLGVIAWFVQQTLSEIRTLRGDMTAVKSDLRDVNTRLDERVIRTVDEHSRRLDIHDDRLRVLESDVQVLKSTRSR